MKNFRAYLKANVKAIRKQHKLTQHQLADKIQVNRKTIGAIEEERAVGLETVYLISREFGYTMDQLLTRRLEWTH